MKRNYLLDIVIVFMVLSACDNTPDNTKIISDNAAEKKPRTETINARNNATAQFTPAASENTGDESLNVMNKEPLTAEDLKWQAEKSFQEITISSAQDTTIICKEGTVLKIKAESFILNNSLNPANGKLIIKIKEYYKISEMVLANLSTTANEEILETGGMIYIEVFNNGQQCQIKDGAFIQFGFPHITAKDKMKLFKGMTGNDNNINWLLTTTDPTEDPTAIYTVVEEMPVFIGGDAARMRYFAENIKYPPIAKEMGISGTVFVTFVVNEDGRVSGARILRGIGGGCNEAVLSAVDRMSNWLPGIQEGKPVKVQFIMPIKFSLSDSLMASASGSIYEEAYTDSVVSNVHSDFLDSYLFNSANLGWMNCDRFLSQTSRTNYSVSVNNPGDLKMRIVFHRFKSIQNGIVANGKVIFRNVPINENITIVATKTVGNSMFFATKETVTSSKIETELALRPVTYGAFRKFAEQLDNLK